MNSIKMPTGRGVSQIKFTEDGKGLIVGMRRDDQIYQWDVRYLKEAMIKFQLARNSNTNQRLYFDIVKLPNSHTP